MRKYLRLLVLSGALALMASPVFADSGPGGSNPPPGGGTGGGTGTGPGITAAPSSSATVITLETLLAWLGL